MKRDPEDHFDAGEVKGKSLNRQFVGIVFLMVISIIIISLISNIYSVQKFNEKFNTSNQKIVELSMVYLDKALENVEGALSNILLNNTSTYPLLEGKTSRAQIAAIELSNDLQKMNAEHRNVDGFAIFDEAGHHQIAMFQGTPGYEEKIAIRSYLLTVQEVSDQWYPVEILDKNYIFRIYMKDGIYVAAFADIDSITEELQSSKYNIFSRIYIENEDGTILNQPDEGQDTKATRDVIIKQKSARGNFVLVTTVARQLLMRELYIILATILLLTIVSFLMLQWLGIFMKKRILKPVNNLVSAMNEVEKGNLETRVQILDEYDEFKLVGTHFNQMLIEIENLKIQVYEEQNLQQETKLKFLEIQTNPHLFTNTLNVIYSLAQTGKTDLIEEMSMCLIKHYRYMLKSKKGTVLIREELEYVDNYIKIQRIRLFYQLGYQISIKDPEIMDCEIPPLIIHTFIENSVKYGLDNKGSVNICLIIEQAKLDDTPYIKLMVTDTGRGFDVKVLAALNEKKQIIDDKGYEHYGILNVLQRLNIIYQSSAKVHLSNTAPQGAKVELYIPRR